MPAKWGEYMAKNVAAEMSEMMDCPVQNRRKATKTKIGTESEI